MALDPHQPVPGEIVLQPPRRIWQLVEYAADNADMAARLSQLGYEPFSVVWAGDRQAPECWWRRSVVEKNGVFPQPWAEPS